MANIRDCLEVHAVCSLDQCVAVPQRGRDECRSNADCAASTHLACRSRQCIVVDGSGRDECRENGECLRLHSVCSFAQCITVEGPGRDECMINSDCTGSELPECSDGIDNDRDGFIDFPHDPNCDGPDDSSESGLPIILALCGNGMIDPGEECDGGDGCTSSCRREETLVAASSLCGNGVLETGEFCDDANRIDDDGCTSFCRFSAGGGCRNDYECGEGKCVSGICTPLIEGEPCLANNQCASGACTQGSCTAPIERPAPPMQVAGQSTRIDFPQLPGQQLAGQIVSPFGVVPPYGAQPYGVQPSYGSPDYVIQRVPLQAPRGDTGPAAFLAVAGGAAAGLAWVRRKRMRRQ